MEAISFKSGKYDLNMVKDYFWKEISYNKDGMMRVMRTCLQRRSRMTICFLPPLNLNF